MQDETVTMKPRNQAILLLFGGVLFLVLGVWWLTIQGLQNGAYVWILGGAAFLVGGLLKLTRSSQR